MLWGNVSAETEFVPVQFGRSRNRVLGQFRRRNRNRIRISVGLCYSLYNFQRATVMINGTLLVSLPIIKRFGRKFSKSEHEHFLLSFSDQKPLDGYV